MCGLGMYVYLGIYLRLKIDLVSPPVTKQETVKFNLSIGTRRQARGT